MYGCAALCNVGKCRHSTDLEAVVEPLQDRGEAGPLFRHALPALAHDAVHRGRAVGGRVQPTAVHHQLHHLRVTATRVRQLAQGHHLPQQHAERPVKT